MVPPDETLRTSTNHDWSQGSTAGQKDDLELNDGEVAELLRMTTVTNPLEDLADGDEGEKVTADCNPRVLATEAGLESHINPDAVATTKQVHVRGGDEDGVVDQEKLSRREVVHNVDKVIYPINSSPQPHSSTRDYPRC